MIQRRQSFLWLSLQMGIAVTGAASALFSLPVGLAFGVISTPLMLMTLLMGWKVRHHPQQHKNLSDMMAGFGLLVFGAVFFLLGLIVALGALLLIANLAMNTQMNSYRQFYFSQLNSFVFLLAGAAQATSGSYLLVMALYCLFACFSLTEAWLDRSSHLNSHNDGTEITGPGLWQRSLSGLAVVTLASVLYLLIPRLEALNIGGWESISASFYSDQAYHNQSWLNQANSEPAKKPKKQLKPGDLDDEREFRYQDLKEITELSDFNLLDEDSEGYEYKGFNEHFDIRTTDRSGKLDLQTVVARMRASHGSYLKIRSFDHFDGLSWKTANEDISTKLAADQQGRITVPGDKPGNFLHTVYIDQTIPAWLPSAANPVNLWLPSSAIALDQFGQPLLPGALRAGTRYTVESHLAYLGDRPTSYAAKPTKQDLQIPNRFDPRIRRLSRKLVKGSYDPFTKAQIIERHLRENYRYSFSSITESQGRTPLSEFLFDTREGHCEYFASAMVMMLRTVGVPARLVTGFSATTKNPLTGYYEIRAIDGHAWVEAWVDSRWVTFEPTAYYDLPRPEHNPSASEQISEYSRQLIKLDSTLNDPQNSGAGFSTTALISQAWLTLSALIISLLAWFKLAVMSLWPILLTLLLLSSAAWFSRLFWLPRLKRVMAIMRLKQHQPRHTHEALKFYLQQLQTIFYRVPRAQSQLFDDWLTAVEAHYGDQPQLQLLATQLEQVLYYEQTIAQDQISKNMQTLANRLLDQIIPPQLTRRGQS